MRLNINNEDPDQGEQGTTPIKHSPEGKGPIFTNTTLLILLVAILASGVFLLFKYHIIRPGMFSGKAPAESAPTTGLADPWKTPPAVAAAPDTSARKGPEGPGGAQPEVHRYAVYISSYRVRQDAEEEVSRWVAAGFTSFVSDAGGWHRVAFGGYEAPGEAAEKAEKWKQAFENGYWIGRAN